jgi:hypothetical protein
VILAERRNAGDAVFVPTRDVDASLGPGRKESDRGPTVAPLSPSVKPFWVAELRAALMAAADRTAGDPFVFR